MSRIVSFSGPNAFLSNFHLCEVAFEGKIYKSSEHAYMAAKTLDPDLREFIAQQTTPGRAKRAGDKIPLRPGWDDIRVHMMRTVLLSKFSNPELRERLQATAPHELIEGNSHGDTFWGECPLGSGKNMLGKLLMEIRDDITARFGE